MKRIAHIIMAHKEPEQLERLIKRLSHPQFDFFIHVDRNTNIEEFSFLERIPCVTFIENRNPCNWGGYSFVHAITNSIAEVLRKNSQYAFFNLLSAQDYPIKDSNYIYKYYLKHDGFSFVSYDESNNTEWWQKASSRYERFHFTDVKIRGKYVLQRLLNQVLPKRKFPLSLNPYGAAVSSWWTITSECAAYIVDFLEHHPELVKFMKYTWGADEFLYSTIIMNSEFSDKVINDNLRFIEWERDSAHPRILKGSDYDALLRSKKLFARKFDMKIDSSILDMLDTFLDRGPAVNYLT